MNSDKHTTKKKSPLVINKHVSEKINNQLMFFLPVVHKPMFAEQCSVFLQL